MKVIVPLSMLLTLTACQTTPEQQESSYTPTYERYMSDLDNEKYSNAEPEIEASRIQFCQSPTIQNCLSATSDECIKIHRKETYICNEKFNATYGEVTEKHKAFANSYVNGCTLGGMVKYGKKGPQSTMQCLKNN
nr:hypothetical protein [uncultured Pseudomonas sp.]